MIATLIPHARGLASVGMVGVADVEAFYRKAGGSNLLRYIAAERASQARAAAIMLDSKPINPARDRRERLLRVTVEAFRSAGGERWRAAIHEAGHVVAARSEGFDVLAVMIDDGAAGGGAAWIDWRGGGRTPITTAAGPLAELLELRGRGARPQAGDMPIGRDERRHLEEACRRRGVTLQVAVDQAAAILRQRWGDVERVAGRLAMRGEVEEDELRELLN